MKVQTITLAGLCALTLTGCSFTLGKKSRAVIASFPAETCVAKTLLNIPSVSDVEITRREIAKVKILLPRRTDTRQNEDVAFRYGNHPFGVHTNITKGHEGKVEISGVASGQCPPTGLLETYDEMVEIVEPALAKACFNNAQFERSSSRKCDTS